MGLGVTMKGFNAIYFGNTVDFLFEFVPQICLLLALFGWMDSLIIAKWLYPVDIQAIEDTNSGTRAPIVNMLNAPQQLISNFTDIFTFA